MIAARGWIGVIMGLLWIGLAIYMQIYSALIVKEAENMQKNGFCYAGESQVTSEQYDMIKEYNGKNDYEVIVTSLEPLTVKYGFLSLDKYNFLTTTKMPDKSVMLALVLIFPTLGGVIGLLQLFHGFKTIGKKEFTSKVEAK